MHRQTAATANNALMHNIVRVKKLCYIFGWPN